MPQESAEQRRKREETVRRSKSSEGAPEASKPSGVARGSTERAKQLEYILQEIDLGHGPSLQIKYGGKGNFGEFEKFYKSMPDFQPAEADLPMFNKYKFFVPENEPKPDAQGAQAITDLEHMRMAAAGQPGNPSPQMVQHQIAEQRAALQPPQPASGVLGALGGQPQQQDPRLAQLLQLLGNG